MRSAAHPTPSKPIEARETMPLRDLFLDFAGRKDPADPIHARLDALEPGAEVGLTLESESAPKGAVLIWVIAPPTY